MRISNGLFSSGMYVTLCPSATKDVNHAVIARCKSLTRSFGRQSAIEVGVGGTTPGRELGATAMMQAGDNCDAHIKPSQRLRPHSRDMSDLISLDQKGELLAVACLVILHVRFLHLRTGPRQAKAPVAGWPAAAAAAARAGGPAGPAATRASLLGQPMSQITRIDRQA
jgi:hypothetical protein